MSLFRILFLAALLYLAWRVLRVLLAKFRNQPAVSPPDKPYLPMAQCAKCGAHVPQDTLSQKGCCGRCAESK